MSSASSQSSFTPSPQRKRHIAASPWKPPLRGSPDKPAWDVSKLPRALATALAPKATIDVKLRATNTLRRCTEESDSADRERLRREPSLIPTIGAIADSVDASASGARVRVHCLSSFVNLLGESADFDLLAVHSEELDHLLVACLRDEHTICVAAAAQLLRRISELNAIAHLVVLQDEWFSAACHILETADEESVNPHLLSALINVAGNAKAQFVMARSARLLHILVEHAFECSTLPSRCLQAAKCCANLLAFPDNCAEIKRGAPSLVNAMLECADFAGRALRNDASAASLADHVLFEELRDVSRLVLEELHSMDLVTLHTQLAAELASGRAVATRMRSHVLSPQAFAAEQLRERLATDWTGAVTASIDTMAPLGSDHHALQPHY